MTLQGILVIDLVALVLIVALIQMARSRRLNVGYAALWLLAVVACMTLVSISPLLRWVTAAVGALFPASALSLLAFIFIFAVLIFFSTVLSRLARQLDGLAHALALARDEILTEVRREKTAPPQEKAQNPQSD